MDMHHINPLIQKKRTDPIVGLRCHQLPVEICRIKPWPHALPVSRDKKALISPKAARLPVTDPGSPAFELRFQTSRRQERLPSALIIQLEDHRPDVESLATLSLQAIDTWAVPFLNTIFSANNVVAFNLNNAKYTFVFEPEAEHARPVRYAPEIIATLVANNHRFVVGLEYMDFIEALDGVNTHKLPEEIQCAFYEAWFDSIFEKLEQWRGARIHVESLNLKPHISKNDGYHLYFSLSRQSDKLETKGHVSMGRGAMQWLAEGYAKVMNNGNFPGADQFPFELGFEIGWMHIDAEEFGRLESNDILLPDRCIFDHSTKSVLVRLADGPCWLGNIEGDTITITAAREIPMGNEIDEQKKTGGSADNDEKAFEDQNSKELLADAVIDGLHINLVFEVGRRKVTLQELKKIRPGYTFDLAMPLDRSISVVANGKIVGKGTLVQIDHRIGVRLMEIIP
jgi:flagellar motor switch/type III secretory pathway protein FliN